MLSPSQDAHGKNARDSFHLVASPLRHEEMLSNLSFYRFDPTRLSQETSLSPPSFILPMHHKPRASLLELHVSSYDSRNPSSVITPPK